MDYSRHDIYTYNHVGFSKFPLLIYEKNAQTGANISTFWVVLLVSVKSIEKRNQHTGTSPEIL